MEVQKLISLALDILRIIIGIADEKYSLALLQ